MAIFHWVDGNVPNNIKITQVYGIIFTKDGRVLLRKEDNKYSLAGGKPEVGDDGIQGTLRRELIEEINVKINDPYMVGYQLVDEEDGSSPYAQVRMTALIESIEEKKPDPATGLTYDRVLVPYYKASELLNWGDVGAKQIETAFFVAKKNFNFSKITNEITIL